MNWSAILKGFAYLIQAIAAPTPEQRAIKNALPAAAKEDWLFLQYCAAYPRLRQLENANVSLATALGATVHLNPATGHVITIDPPKDPSGRPDGANRGGLMPPGT